MFPEGQVKVIDSSKKKRCCGDPSQRKGVGGQQQIRRMTKIECGKRRGDGR